MAGYEAALATGTPQNHDLRRRNVVGVEKGGNGVKQNILLEFDTKKKAPRKATFINFLDEWEVIIAPLIFTAFSFFTRMWRIGKSDIVTWDEAQ
ncbi:hypothetical protein ACJ72_05594 [Emergomyces africanus]|uniref:Uncharacterized protein n=1 Tax=Emergomyces africanus TaxID=1955775 RepID=A0A1B7NTL0_9EURO|nr:hypothetical protein ACJ72_05594 [Emergomyces africanus]